jgi:hypothetical protein
MFLTCSVPTIPNADIIIRQTNMKDMIISIVLLRKTGAISICNESKRTNEFSSNWLVKKNQVRIKIYGSKIPIIVTTIFLNETTL